MKKTRHTEDQIAFAPKQAETGTAVSEVIRRMGISEPTFYRWEKVYGERDAMPSSASLLDRVPGCGVAEGWPSEIFG